MAILEGNEVYRNGAGNRFPFECTSPPYWPGNSSRVASVEWRAMVTLPAATRPHRQLSRHRLLAAMALALVADLLQLAAFPLFIEGATSPADDAVDAVLFIVLTALTGWHWEFAPSFLVELIPGVDLVPLWSLAVANVYRKERKRVKLELEADKS